MVHGPGTARAGDTIRMQITIAGGQPPYRIVAVRHGDPEANQGTEIARFESKYRTAAFECPLPNPGKAVLHVSVFDGSGGGPGLRIHTVDVLP